MDSGEGSDIVNGGPGITPEVHFIVPGEPLTKKRPIVARDGGVYVPKPNAAHEEVIAWYARSTGVQFHPDARLRMTVRFYTSVRKQSIPDLDNLLKLVLDGIQKGGMYRDDSQVVEILTLRFDKQEKPRTEITVMCQ